MPTESPNDSAPRESTRIPYETRVNIEFEKFSGFITEYSANISNGGIFIRTQTPKPMGTILSFEFKLADNFKLIQGLGEVVWVRSKDLGPEKPAGMGIRFHEIDAQSKELITTMIDQYIRRGGKPFNLDDAPPPEESGEPAPTPKGPAAVEEDFKALFSVESQSGPVEPPVQLIEDAAVASPPPEPIEVEKSAELVIDEAAVSEKIPAAPKIPPRRMPQSFEVDRPTSSPSVLPKILILLVVLGGLGGAGFYFRQQLMKIAGLTKPADEPPAAPVKIEVAPKKAVPEPPKAAPTAQVASAPAKAEPSKPEPAKVAAEANALDNITWETVPGETVVTLWGDGAIGASRFSKVRVESAPPREVIKLTAMRRAYPKTKMEVGTPHLKRIRTGFHLAEGGGELHVVLDLANAATQVKKVETDGPRIRIHLGQ